VRTRLRWVVILCAALAAGSALADPPVRASGHATYGYGGWYGAPYYSGWYGPWGWGWPYWGGYYPWPYAAAYPVMVDPSELPVAVETDVVPKKARLTLDGTPIGKAKDFNGTWDRLYVAPGTRTLEFSFEGRKTLRVELHASAGEAVRIAHELAVGEGVETRTIGLAADTPERTPQFEVVQSDAGTVPAAIPSGFLRMRVEPRDAAVYLDGGFLASGDELARMHGALPLAAGTHRVEIARPGFGTEERILTIGEGESVTLEVELEPSR